MNWFEKEIIECPQTKMWKPTTVKDYLEMIIDVSADYDGYKDAENLKALIDEIASYAVNALIVLKTESKNEMDS